MLSEAQAQAVLRQLETQGGGGADQLLVSAEKSNITVHNTNCLPSYSFPCWSFNFSVRLKSASLFICTTDIIHTAFPQAFFFFFPLRFSSSILSMQKIREIKWPRKGTGEGEEFRRPSQKSLSTPSLYRRINQAFEGVSDTGFEPKSLAHCVC